MKRENTGQRCTNEIPEKDEICSECCELLHDYLRGTSVKQIVELQMEVDDLVSLNHRLNDILDKTANALHGGPMDKGLWSFHDLPDLATALRSKLELAKTEVQAVLDNIPNAVHVREGAGDEDVFASLAVSVAKLVHQKGVSA
jgi:hypothetical protein